MKHKTWFRLVIKAIGVLLVSFALPEAVQWAVYFSTVFTFQQGSRPDAYAIQSYLMQVLQVVTQLGIGLYLFFGGKWIVDKCIPSNRPYCPECGYDLSHSANAANCPECGVALPARTPA